VELERISDDQRRSEEELWPEFESEHGRLLGAVFDALAQTLRFRETLTFSRRPRLADWGIYAAASYEVFGWGSETFLKDWGEVVRAQKQGTLDGSPVAQAILSFMENRSEWIGLANELHTKLEDEAEDLKINTKREKTWPKSPSWLWRRIREVQPLLVAMGIKADTGESRRNGTRITLQKISPSGDDPKGGSKNPTAATDAATGHSPQVSGFENGGSRGSNYVYFSGSLSHHQGDVGVDMDKNGSETRIPRELPMDAATAATERKECIHETVPGVCVWCREWKEDHGRLPTYGEDVEEYEI